MTDADDRIQHSFARFRVTSERMRDGRAIHFYEWPDDPPAARAGDDRGSGTTPPAGRADDRPRDE